MGAPRSKTVTATAGWGGVCERGASPPSPGGTHCVPQSGSPSEQTHQGPGDKVKQVVKGVESQPSRGHTAGSFMAHRDVPPGTKGNVRRQCDR